jgi:Tfp pilus assembly protein FimT
MLARISEPNFEQTLFRRALAASLLVHLALAISTTISLARAKAVTEQTVYSVTLEGGKSLGGISQTPKTSKTELAPPKNTAPKAAVQEKKEPEKSQ